MAFDSFRDFVNALDKAGELKRISQPIATELEITVFQNLKCVAASRMKPVGEGDIEFPFNVALPVTNS